MLGDPARGSPMALGERCVGSDGLVLHPLGSGCKVLISCKLGMQGPSLAEGWGLSLHLCWGTSAPCLGDTEGCPLLR